MDNAPEDVRHMLGPNEQIELYIKQKIYHPKINVDSVVITNERIILRHPHAMGLKKDFTDFNYQDVANVVLDKGIVRSTVRCVLRFGGEPLTLNDLPNSDAEKAYGIIRENLVRYQAPFSAGYAGVPPAGYAPAPAGYVPAPGYAAPYPQQGPPPGGFAAGMCRNCGAGLVPGERFCGRCGAAV